MKTVASVGCRVRPHAASQSHISMLFDRRITPEELAAAVAMTPLHGSLDLPAYIWDDDEGALRAKQGMCSNCGSKPAKLLTCGACRRHIYCNQLCQKALRSSHKALCDRYKAARASIPGARALYESQLGAADRAIRAADAPPA